MEKVDIKSLIDAGEIKEGSQVVKVPIKKVNGNLYSGKTYMIPIKFLYYNDQNGRIGTAISEYQAEHRDDPLEKEDMDKYNNAIQDMIEQDEKAKIDELTKDMRSKGQEVAGYVLNDGRVIDGNRRFTACRKLQAESAQQRYFEAVLIDDLDASRIDDKAILKKLELKIQFSPLGREDYDPIDRAIDVYKAVKIDQIMTEKDYAENADVKPNEVKKELYEAELVVEFLKFINADPTNYAIAKNLRLDGPLQELIPKYKNKIRNSPQKNEVLGALFSKLIQLREDGNIDDKDFKVSFRPIVKKVVDGGRLNEFLNAMSGPADTIIDALSDKPTKDAQDLFQKIGKSSEASQALEATKNISRQFVQKAEDDDDRAQPAKLVWDALGKLNSVEMDMLSSLEDRDKKYLSQGLTKIQDKVETMRQELG